MRLSKSFGKTLRNAPADAEMASHQLLIRANFIRPLAAGIYTYMPFGYRVMKKIERILEEEMDAIGGQQMFMPNLHPRSIWDATGRWDEWGDIMMRIDAGGSREYGISPTHEEVVVDLVGREVDSYRDLPQVIYHISKKFRDEARPRGGLLRLREFIMKDAYSINTTEEGLDEFYPHMVQAYLNVFNRCGVDVIQIQADVGAMGGKSSHEFVVPHEQGEDIFIRSEGGNYAANVEAAEFVREGEKPETLNNLEKAFTPDCTTIAVVADFIGVPTSETLKAVFYWWTPTGKEEKEGRFVFAVVRGDLDINEVKVTNALGGGRLRPATETEIRKVGAEPGYASPIGLSVAPSLQEEGAIVLADPSIEVGGNFVVGANEREHHFTGTNYPRDFSITAMQDIAQADTGHLSTIPGEGKLIATRAIEAGHCFKLGKRYSEPTNTTVLDQNGKPQHVYMGSYGIGVDRLMAIIVELHHDKDGIKWPASVAPYDIHLAHVGKGDEPRATADSLYTTLQEAGYDVLYDDREASPGVKFKDADLIGVPIRISVGQRSLDQGGVEVKRRSESERRIVAVDEVLAHIEKLMQD